MTRKGSIRRRMSEAEEGAIDRSKGPPKTYMSMPDLTYKIPSLSVLATPHRKTNSTHQNV